MSAARRHIFLLIRMARLCTVTVVLFVASLLSIYEKVPDKFTPLLPKFLQMVKGGGHEVMIVVQLFGEVAKRSPEVSLNELHQHRIVSIIDFSANDG